MRLGRRPRPSSCATWSASTAVRDIQIGIAHGRLRSGTYGHTMRRTFVCLGDAVNLSARLMSKAPPGAIWVTDDVREMAGDAYIWQNLPELTVKGKSATIVASALQGSLERASRRKTRFELALVGRREELAALDASLEGALAGEGRIVGIAAEAGMGKSRLVAEFVRGGPPARAVRGFRRMPVVRRELQLPGVARDLAAAARPRG